MKIAGYTITPNTITVVVDGATRIIDSSRDGFDEIPKMLLRRKRAGGCVTKSFLAGSLSMAGIAPWSEDDEDQLAKYLDMKRYIVRVTHGEVQIADDRVLFKGLPIEGVLVDRLIEFQSKGYDTEPLSLFLQNLMANPIESAREELYLWLEGAKLPITDDGHFLAWKAVRADYRSHHDGATYNRIGDKPSVPRDYCDTDRHRTCSTGLHFCSYDYLPHFASGNSRIMIVKINPADVVAIPSDYDNTKGRAWTYEIIGEVPYDEVPDYFKVPVVSVGDGEIEQHNPSDWLDDDEDAEDYNDDEWDEDDDEAMSSDVTTQTVAEAAAQEVVTGEPIAVVELSPAPYEVPGKRDLKSMIRKWGQRKTASQTGIPRTTLQDIIARYWPDKANRPAKKD